MMVIEKADQGYLYTSSHGKIIDMSMGSGSQIIGHNHPLISPISQQLSQGTIYSAPNLHAPVVANYLKADINAKLSDRYIFCNSGTEANMRAIRLARAYTGRDKIGFFEGGWHGGLDGLLSHHPDSKGIPCSTDSLFTRLPYNDINSLDQVSSDLAAVIIEPIQGSNPRSDLLPFLNALQEKCRLNNVLLVIDEVMTGFRLSAQGAVGRFNLSPDIVTYGKVLGAGFPIGAMGAREEIMSTPNVFYGGTFSANPLSMLAAKLTLEAIKEGDLINYNTLEQLGEDLRASLNSFFIKKGMPRRVMGCGSINRIIFTDYPIKSRRDRDFHEATDQRLFYDALLNDGVFIAPNGIIHLSMCHRNQLDEIIQKIKQTSLLV